MLYLLILTSSLLVGFEGRVYIYRESVRFQNLILEIVDKILTGVRKVYPKWKHSMTLHLFTSTISIHNQYDNWYPIMTPVCWLLKINMEIKDIFYFHLPFREPWKIQTVWEKSLFITSSFEHALHVPPYIFHTHSQLEISVLIQLKLPFLKGL